MHNRATHKQVEDGCLNRKMAESNRQHHNRRREQSQHVQFVYMDMSTEEPNKFMIPASKEPSDDETQRMVPI
jgi:hypothetical protein